jgi:D-alanine-D-alanine ligase
VVAIDIESQDLEENIRKIKSYNIEVAFIALHGRFGEDGTIQKILEDLGIPYTGSGVLASKFALDKVLSRQRFLSFGLNVPDYTVLEKKDFDKTYLSLSKFKFPLVVKPACQGSSIGLSIVEDEDSLFKAIDLAFSFDERIIIEEYIEGRELTVGILDEEALPVIEIIPKKKFFDYEAKYTPGLTEYVVPAKLEEKIASQAKSSALLAHKSLDCFGFSRVDMILNKENKVFVLEVNTIPGLTETSLLPKAAKAVGISFLELCLKLIDSAYRRNKVSVCDK